MKLGLEPEWLELERSCAKFSRFSSLCCLFSFHHNARHVDVHKSMPSCGEKRPCNDIHLFYGTKCWITRNTNKKVYFNNRKTKLCVVSFWLKYGLWIKLSQKNNDSFYDIKICRWTPLCWSYDTNPILYSWNITFLRFDSNKQGVNWVKWVTVSLKLVDHFIPIEFSYISTKLSIHEWISNSHHDNTKFPEHPYNKNHRLHFRQKASIFIHKPC